MNPIFPILNPTFPILNPISPILNPFSPILNPVFFGFPISPILNPIKIASEWKCGRNFQNAGDAGEIFQNAGDAGEIFSCGRLIEYAGVSRSMRESWHAC